MLHQIFPIYSFSVLPSYFDVLSKQWKSSERRSKSQIKIAKPDETDAAIITSIQERYINRKCNRWLAKSSFYIWASNKNMSISYNSKSIQNVLQDYLKLAKLPPQATFSSSLRGGRCTKHTDKRIGNIEVLDISQMLQQQGKTENNNSHFF